MCFDWPRAIRTYSRVLPTLSLRLSCDWSLACVISSHGICMLFSFTVIGICFRSIDLCNLLLSSQLRRFRVWHCALSKYAAKKFYGWTWCWRRSCGCLGHVENSILADTLRSCHFASSSLYFSYQTLMVDVFTIKDFAKWRASMERPYSLSTWSNFRPRIYGS